MLLLDEPFSALDRQLRERMQVELKLLQRELGISFVFVTHDQAEALVMSDRVVVMNEGRIEQIGTPQHIYQQPTSAFVASFVGTQNFADGTLEPDGTVAYRSARFTPTAQALAAYSTGDRLRLALRAETIRVSHAEPAQATNKAAGELAGVSFLGGEIQYVVITAAGTEVFARTPLRDAPDLNAGDTVWCAWDSASVLVYPGEAEA